MTAPDDSHWERVKELFAEASELPTQLRAGFLDDACEGDASLRGEVESLLGHHVPSEVTVGVATADGGHHLAEGPGTVIGRYKLLEEIGQGGMGVVYMAEQTEPVRRMVALKIIKLGMDTKEVVARFEAERQALAMMDHPNIAKVLDAGATATGRPYFVMELVRGVPITTYCDEQELAARERLELFRQVCLAIQHAHTKGVIHRDIKPTNVMITLHDGVPVPRIIDFGIAKATDQSLTEKTFFTQYAQIIGTPEYMAPEQAELSGLDIDTRADIYSLGVLLYELVTGTKPFDMKSLMAVGYDEMLRTIREVDPPKPSTRVSTMGRLLTSSAARQSGDARSYSRLLSGDLDWIVMRALEKDRTRRYETAADFARDVGRHLADEPVDAGPPSAVYRARKLARRHRGGILAAGVAALALVSGTVLGAVAFRNALRDRETALEEREAALLAYESERAQRRETEQAYSFLTNQLISGAPEDSPLPNSFLADKLSVAWDEAERRFGDQPRLRARLAGDLARGFVSVGALHEAQQLLPRAHEFIVQVDGRESRRSLDVLNDMSEVLLSLGDTEQAVHLQRRVVDVSREVFGERDPQTMSALGDLAVVFVQAGQADDATALLAQVGPRGGGAYATRQLIDGEVVSERFVGEPLSFAFSDRGSGDVEISLAADPRQQVRHKLLVFAQRPSARVEDKCRAAWFLLGAPERSADDVDAALDLAVEASERLPDDPTVLDLLARAQFLSGRADEAADSERRALSLVPPHQTLLRADLDAALVVFESGAPPAALTFEGLFERPWQAPVERVVRRGPGSEDVWVLEELPPGPGEAPRVVPRQVPGVAPTSDG